jgi:phage terminase large subunit-like protein
MEAWRKCGKSTPEKLFEELKGRSCYAAVDLSTTIDLTDINLTFPPVEKDEKFKILTFPFIPKEEMWRRERRDRVPYSTWLRQGYITATEGNEVDYRFVIAKLVELSEIFEIEQVAYDRWGGMAFKQDLEELGFVMLDFGQGTKSMSAPMKMLLGHVLDGKIEHGNHPVMNWAASSVVATQNPAGDIKPSKPDRQKSANRIDPFVALIMSFDLAIRNERGEKDIFHDGEQAVMVI